MCRTSIYVLFRNVYISGAKHNRTLKFSMQTCLTHINIIFELFEYYHASVILDNEDVLYLEDGNVCRPVLKNNTAPMFFSQKAFPNSITPFV